MTKQWAQEAELIQELLDSGLSRRCTADSLGMCHKTVGRIIDRFEIEFYKAFDECGGGQEYISLIPSVTTDWDCEDILDDWILNSTQGNRVVLPSLSSRFNKTVSLLYEYLDREHGGLDTWMQKYCRYTKDQFFRECCECGKVVQIDLFYRNKGRLDAKCKVCFYSAKDKKKMGLTIRAYTNKRRALVRCLPGVWDNSKRDKMLRTFPELLIGEEYADDHFIPLATGHCGTYVGNMSPLEKSLNSSKNSYNPFEWFEANRQRFDLEQSAFDALVVKLAQQNGLTSEELRDFTYWCFANQRSIDEVRADNERYGYKRPSLEIWREAIGLPFPIRVDFGDLSLDHAVAA